MATGRSIRWYKPRARQSRTLSRAIQTGRRHLKFSPKIFFQDKTGYIHTNEEFISAAYEALELSPDACWFVYKMEIKNLDELHMSAIIVRADASVLYADSKERAAEWRQLVDQVSENAEQ